MNEEIRSLIAAADRAIREERFDDLMAFYTDDAVLAVRPGQFVQGKEAIRSAFVKIAAYFQHSIVPRQGRMVMLEAGDTVLVLSQTLLDADNKRHPRMPWNAEPPMFIGASAANGCVLSTTPMAHRC